jgi:hypothetical protein
VNSLSKEDNYSDRETEVKVNTAWEVVRVRSDFEMTEKN